MEYGGYLELERGFGPGPHPGALALNSARNALAYVLEARGIGRLLVPAWLCGSVAQVCAACGTTVIPYGVDERFRPRLSRPLESGEWLYVVNYYGQLGPREAEGLQKTYGRVIWDNVQAFFQPPVSGMDTLYTCRKFFGVPDGAYLYTDCPLSCPLERDESRERMEHLLGRRDTGCAGDFYAKYTENEERLEHLPLRRMSALTEALMSLAPCEEVRRRREENFRALHGLLGGRDPLGLTVPTGPYAYPLLVEDGPAVRAALREQKIFLPLLWPEAAAQTQDPLAARYARDILPLPVDQRYTPADMERLAAAVLERLG